MDLSTISCIFWNAFVKLFIFLRELSHIQRGGKYVPVFLCIILRGANTALTASACLPTSRSLAEGFAVSYGEPKKPLGGVAPFSSKLNLTSCPDSNSFSTIPLRSDGEFMTKNYLLSLSSDISIAQKNIWSLRKQTQEIDIWFSCSQTIALILSSRVKWARPNISYGEACCSVQP